MTPPTAASRSVAELPVSEPPPAWLRRAVSAAAKLIDQSAWDEARQLLIATIERAPRHADALYLLGTVAWRSGDRELAEALARQVLALTPEHVPSWVLLGNVLQAAGRLEESAVCYQSALSIHPQSVDAIYNWGNTCEQQGLHAQALRLFQRAVELAPEFLEARNNLANLLRQTGELARAAAHLEYARRRWPDSMLPALNLSNVYLAMDRPAQALESIDAAIALCPQLPVLYSNKGNVLRALNRSGEALAAFAEAIRRDPGRAEFYVNRAAVYQTQGRLEEALADFRQALASEPDNAAAQGAALFSLHYDPELGTEALLEAHRSWGRRHAAGLGRRAPYANEPDPERRLRIGLVSADFRQHPVAFFTVPAWRHRDRERVHLVAYASNTRTDSWTEQVRGAVDEWVDAAAFSDRELAARIEADRIDVVIDLAGHTAGNRLLVFARSPAPVAVSWLGYFNTTGLEAIDYLLVDAIVAPPEEAAPFVEKPLSVGDGCYLSYLGPEAPPAVLQPPGGPITFGCFNALAKITSNVAALWAGLLEAVPGSRLLLKNQALSDASTRERCRERFAACGAPPERLLLEGGAPHRELLQQYARVDVALDPFPYNGGTTTCEALWMGLPVVTLSGDRFVSRVGATILTHAGCAGWIARTPDAYIRLAAELAEARRQGRICQGAALREQVRRSVLGDVEGFQRRWEDALRLAWRHWCRSRH